MPFAQTTATKKIARLNKRIKAIQGGTSASKTISTLLVLIAKSQTDRKPKMTSVVSESMPHLRRGAMRDFLNIMHEHHYYKEDNWNRTEFIYTFETGSKMEFFSADSPDKTRGPRRDRLFINECNNIPFEAFNQLEVRTREEIYLDWNPTNEFWFYTEILNNPEMEVDHIIITYKDNEALEESIVKSIESRKANKSWWAVYGLGQLGEVEGKIYRDWKLDLDEIPHEARLERYGLDFGYSNDPTSVVAIYSFNGGYIVDEVMHRKGLHNRDIANHMLNMPPALICADSAEPKSIDEIASYGLSIIGVSKGHGSVKAGIDYVQEQRITVTKNSPNVKKAYNNYLWKVDKDGKILNEPDHYLSDAMDALRYGFESLKPRVEDDEPIDNPITSLIY
jgi:phage terminase large subunit